MRHGGGEDAVYCGDWNASLRAVRMTKCVSFWSEDTCERVMHAVRFYYVDYSSSGCLTEGQVTSCSLCCGSSGETPGYEWTVKKNDTHVVLETVKPSQHM